MASRSILRAQVRKRSNTPAICQHHEGQKAVLVCIRPGCAEAFACVKCVSTNHRGHEMEDITDFASKKKQILQARVKTGKEIILVSILQQIKSTRDKISVNTKTGEEFQEKIIRRCNTIKKELDDIAAKYTEMNKTTQVKNDKILTEHKDQLEALFIQYKSELEEYEETIEMGSESDIILSERANFPTSPNLSKIPEIDVHDVLQFKDISSDQLEELFGNITTVKNTDQITADVTKKIHFSKQDTTALSSVVVENINIINQFELKGDTGYSCNYLHPLSRGLFVWFFGSSNALRVTNNGRVKNIINIQPTKKGPVIDVCISPVDGTIWAGDHAQSLHQTKSDGSVLQSFNLSCYPLCASRGQYLVSAGMDVQIATTSGKVIRTIALEGKGCNENISCVVQCQKTGRFAFRHFNKVSVTDEDMRLLYKIHGEAVTTSGVDTRSTGNFHKESYVPGRMCFDANGDLLVIDYEYFNVIMFNSRGQYVRTIIQETEDKRPTAISTAPDGTLWVAYHDFVIKQIQYK